MTSITIFRNIGKIFSIERSLGEESIFYPSQQTARGLWKTFLVTLVKFNADYSATVCSVGLPSVPG
ncbi:hypothetical protein T05_12113 [Trichinella murrelli]|uniref:Uncharacterized protein n=1 Tax=Trichinella murrelli TaxID=144512 RepID=A0A0V0TBW8_9BILA|nr:hypothetical protein T05_12113 [Trichinella murrelli]